jgi:hypothetical protein
VRGHASDAYEVARGRRLARWRLGGGVGVRRRTGGGRHGGKAGIGFEEDKAGGSALVFFLRSLGKVTCVFFSVSLCCGPKSGWDHLQHERGLSRGNKKQALPARTDDPDGLFRRSNDR